jgi:hypothetical protein
MGTGGRLLVRFVGDQTAIAADQVDARAGQAAQLARWLLMWGDRIRPEHITVTHEFLALLLGVRRPGVTDTMNDLEGRGLIRSSRGKVLLLNRKGLKLAANGFYGVPEAEYDRAVGTSGSVAIRGETQPLD